MNLKCFFSNSSSIPVHFSILQSQIIFLTFLLNAETRTKCGITANTMSQLTPIQLFSKLSLKKVPQQELKKKIYSITFYLSIYISMYQSRKTGKHFSPCLTPKTCITFRSCQQYAITLEESQNFHLQRYGVKTCLSWKTFVF